MNWPRGSRRLLLGGSLRLIILHNQDFVPGDQGQLDLASRADVLDAACDVRTALLSNGHQVTVMGVDRGGVAGLATLLEGERPDLVFNLCESLGGDARNEVVIPALLDLLEIPYTGTGPLGLALALRKEVAKGVLRGAGVDTPRSVTLGSEETVPEVDLGQVRNAAVRYPLIIKPSREDASSGLTPESVVADEEALWRRVAWLRRTYRQPILAEEFIHGREFNVGLIGAPPRVLPLSEIDFSTMPAGRPHIVCYEAKWDTSSAAYDGSRPVAAMGLSSQQAEKIESAALRAFTALQLRDYGRCDIRLSDAGVPYVIDVNPNCDLCEDAGLSLAAQRGGLSYAQMIESIVGCAQHRGPLR